MNFKSINQILKQTAQFNQVFSFSTDEFSVSNKDFKNEKPLVTQNSVKISTGVNDIIFNKIFQYKVNAKLYKNYTKNNHRLEVRKSQTESSKNNKNNNQPEVYKIEKNQLSVGEGSGLFPLLTPSCQKVLLFIGSYYNNIGSVPSTEYIAQKLGISRTTVTRALRLLNQNGFVYSYQNKIFAHNTYEITQEGKKLYFKAINDSFSDADIKALNMGISKKELLLSRNKKSCQLEYDAHTKSYINNNIYLQSPYPVKLRSNTSKRQDGALPRKERIKKGMAMLRAENKEFIIKHKNNPLIKKALDNPEVRGLIITPIIEKIAKRFELDLKEQLKLVVFDDEILRLAFEEFCIKEKQRLAKIKNPFAYLLFIAKNKCFESKINPDWQWYYQLCEILSIDPLPENAISGLSSPIVSGKAYYVGSNDKLQLETKAQEFKRPCQGPLSKWNGYDKKSDIDTSEDKEFKADVQKQKESFSRWLKEPFVSTLPRETKINLANMVYPLLQKEYPDYFHKALNALESAQDQFEAKKGADEKP